MTASRGSSRVGTAPTTSPSTSPVGTSLNECTAMSIAPSSRASRTDDTKMPSLARPLSGRVSPSPGRGQRHDLDGVTPGTQGRSDVAGLREREGAGPRAQAQHAGHAAPPVLIAGRAEPTR